MTYEGIHSSLVCSDERPASSVGQRGRLPHLNEIIPGDLPIVDGGYYHGVADDGSELLHKVQGEGRFSILWSMKETQVGIEPDGKQSDRTIFGQQ